MKQADSSPHLEILRNIPRGQLVPSDAAARFINDFVATLDLARLGFVERRRPNARAPHPTAKLLKLVLLAWVERIPGQRALAKICRWDVRFVDLAECDPPARSSITRFWRDNPTACTSLFDQGVQHLAQAGLVGMELQALDGTKIRAACSMHTAVHHETEKKS